MMQSSVGLLLFSLDGTRHALPLMKTERVLRALEVTPLPGVPPIFAGVFSLHGTPVPVVNLRGRLGLPQKEVALDDTMVLARTADRVVGFLVDGDTEIAACDAAEIVPAEALCRGARTLAGLGQVADELILIQDLDAFLSIDEGLALDHALRALD